MALNKKCFNIRKMSKIVKMSLYHLCFKIKNSFQKTYFETFNLEEIRSCNSINEFQI